MTITLKEFIRKFFGQRLQWPVISYNQLTQDQKKIIAKEFLKFKNGERNNDRVFEEVLQSI